ncbi:MAG TPA: lysoplasmalogenase [Atribacterota bacterium]|nr:lysoplasmalogenase [Atribacterota bacterium]
MVCRLFTIILLTLITTSDLYFIKTAQEEKRIWTKPLIVPFVVLLYIQFTRQVNLTLLMAFLFSFLGDSFLLFSEKKLFFSAGIFAFLISHIWYIYTFTASLAFNAISAVGYLFPAMPYLIYTWIFFKRLKPFLGHYIIPVILYIVTIMGMSYASLLRFGGIRGHVFWLPFIGSLFFILSDSLLAIRNFRYRQKKGWVSVMLSYVLGQLLIAIGFMG